MDRHDWDARYRAQDLVWSAGPNRFLVEETEGLTPGRALDLACGEGRNALWLAEQGWEVTGADFSPVALAKAARLAAERHLHVTFVEADLLTWQPPEAAFELVALMYLHLPASDLRRVLGHAARAVAPGGTLLVVGHDITNLSEGHGGPQDPDVLFGPDDVVAGLDGFEVVRADRAIRVVETEDGQRQAIDAVVRAVRLS